MIIFSEKFFKIRIIFIFLFICNSTIAIYSEGLTSVQWEKAYVKNDVEVFRDKNPQGGILGMRGRTIVNMVQKDFAYDMLSTSDILV
jgi:hypothetical protein